MGARSLLQGRYRLSWGWLCQDSLGDAGRAYAGIEAEHQGQISFVTSEEYFSESLFSSASPSKVGNWALGKLWGGYRYSSP